MNTHWHGPRSELGTPSAEMKTDFPILRDDLIRLHYRWKIFSSLFGVSKLRDRLLLRRASSFFAALFDMLRDELVLDISRLVDSPKTGGHDNLVLETLIGHLNQMNDTELAIVSSAKLDRIKELAAPFKTLRHKTLAHRSKKEATDSNHAFPEILRASVAEILEQSAAILNGIEGRYFGATTGYDWTLDVGGVNQLVDSLRKAEEYDRIVSEGLVPRSRIAESEYWGA